MASTTTAAPTGRSAFAAALVKLAVVVLPITGLTGIGALGELKGSAAVHVLLLAILVSGFLLSLDQIAAPKPLFVFLVLLLGWILVTALINLETIATTYRLERAGLNKLVTSSMVVGFGAAVAVLSASVMATLDDVDRLFVRPLVVAVIACSVFAVPEILAWLSPAGEALYAVTNSWIHTAENEQGRFAGRLISLAFEAPDLSYFCAIVFPWMVLNYRLRTRDGTTAWRRLTAMLPAILCLALLLLSNSRTGLVMLAAIAGAEALFWIGLRTLRVPIPLAIMAVAAVAIAGLALWVGWSLQQIPAEDADVSNVSRLALLRAQFAIFAQHPVFGVGLGQFGFYAIEALPSWAWSSYEIVNWFDKTPELPPSFNVAGRIAAELGVPGLLIWYGYWGWGMLRAAAAAVRLPSAAPALALNAALFATAAAVMVGGISSDAFRRPETWILVGLLAVHAGKASAGGTES